LPVVRATGGLRDTVVNYDETDVTGTGFMFDNLTVDGLTNTIGWAQSTYFDRPKHVDKMRRTAMAQDNSWGRAAAAYEQLYRDAYARRRGHAFPG
jgi:starch synthase